jgi:hypothetical protein
MGGRKMASKDEKLRVQKLEKRATPRIVGPKTDKNPHDGKPPK